MILGLNTNHEYSGKVYHVQTEDSGLDHPVIITHCFIGGTIIATRKTDYADAVGQDDLEAHLRRVAREQHRGMVQSLFAGEFQKAARMAVMGGGARSRPEIPTIGKSGGRSFRAGDSGGLSGRAPNKLPSGPKRPPPLPARAGVDRATASYGDTQVMDIDDADLIEEAPEKDAELSVEGPLQFPSRLLRADPLDPVVLAYLLEDDPPPR